MPSHIRKPFLGVILALCFCAGVHAQNLSAAFPSLGMSRSVLAQGFGEQGSALPFVADALRLNPAALVHARGLTVSLYRNPWYVPFSDDIRLKSLGGAVTIPDIGSFGIEYIDQEYGDFAVTTAANPDGVGIVTAYERSVAAGYAREFWGEFAAGMQARYVWDKIGGAGAEAFLLGGGVQYYPDAFDRRITFGLSFTEFGTAVEYTGSPTITESEPIIQKDPPPANLNLGVYGEVVRDEHFSHALGLEMTKPFDKRDDRGQAVSSFTNLFNDWSDFPEDAALHTGLAFLWNPLPLGGGWEFFQQFTFGNTSWGPKTGLSSYFTHGLTLGVGAEGVTLTAGYASPWHNVREETFMARRLPQEMFEFSINVTPGLLFPDRPQPPTHPLHRIQVSAGMGQSVRVGRFSREDVGGGFFTFATKHENSLSFGIDAAFYLNERSALVSSAAYSSIPMRIEFSSFFFASLPVFETKIETFSLSSSYRYHPLEEVPPLFVQAGVGIVRFNIVSDLFTPAYSYQSFLTAGMGATLHIVPDLSVVPSVEYRLISAAGGSGVPHLVGNSQLDLIVKLGYDL